MQEPDEAMIAVTVARHWSRFRVSCITLNVATFMYRLLADRWQERRKPLMDDAHMLIYSYGLYLHAGVYVHCWKFYAQEL